MRMDTHVHITPEEISRQALKIGEKEPYFDLLSRTPKNRFATGPEIVAEMKRVGIDKSIVFGFSFNDMGLCRRNSFCRGRRKLRERFVTYM